MITNKEWWDAPLMNAAFHGDTEIFRTLLPMPGAQYFVRNDVNECKHSIFTVYKLTGGSVPITTAVSNTVDHDVWGESSSLDFANSPYPSRKWEGPVPYLRESLTDPFTSVHDIPLH
jgi:hypothetical protein